jgi:hypothetical protein
LVHRSVSSPTSEGAFAAGGELRVHPYSAHGFVLGFTQASGIFGPNVTIVDAAYSLRLIGSNRLEGVTGAVYVDLGPSIGFVSDAPPSPNHQVLGGRAGVAADTQIYNVTIGTVVGYRGGAPLGSVTDHWEGAFIWMLRAGLIFDLAERAR